MTTSVVRNVRIGVTMTEVNDFLLAPNMEAWLEDGLLLFVLGHDPWGLVHWSYDGPGWKGVEPQYEGTFSLPCSMQELWEHQPVIVPHPCPEVTRGGYPNLSFAAQDADTLGVLRVRLAP